MFRSRVERTIEGVLRGADRVIRDRWLVALLVWPVVCLVVVPLFIVTWLFELADLARPDEERREPF